MIKKKVGIFIKIRCNISQKFIYHFISIFLIIKQKIIFNYLLYYKIFYFILCNIYYRQYIFNRISNIRFKC